MAKQTKTKTKGYRKFVGFIYIGISAVLIYTLVINGYRVFEQKNQVVKLEKRKAELEEEKKSLAQEVELLNDDDYVARYARDNYIFSKDGETVVKLPDSKE